MPFQVGHKEYRTKESFNKLSLSMKTLFLDKWIKKMCPTCNKQFDSKKNVNEKIYCSRKCMSSNAIVKNKISLRVRGQNNGNWRGGTSPLRVNIWMMNEYQSWRNKGFERDDYKCVQCGNGGQLHFDHYPIPFADLIRFNDIKNIYDARICSILWELKNGRTLCIKCHRKTESYGFRKKQLSKEEYTKAKEELWAK